MIVLFAILVLCLSVSIAWGIWHDSKALREEDGRLHDELLKMGTEIARMNTRIEPTEKAIAFLAGRLAKLESKQPAGEPIQAYDPQAAKRAQEQARNQGKHRR